MKIIVVISIAAYFTYVKQMFNATNRFYDSRAVGISQDRYCVTALITYNVESVSISDNEVNTLPVCVTSDAAGNRDDNYYCMSDVNREYCISLFNSYVSNNPSYIYNEDVLSASTEDVAINYIVFDVWIIIFSWCLLIVIVMFDYAHTNKFSSSHFNQNDIIYMRRLGSILTVCLLGFLIATVYSYILIHTINCDDNYKSSYVDDPFCSLLTQCAAKVAIIIHPNDVLVNRMGIFTVAFTILLVVGFLCHKSEEARSDHGEIRPQFVNIINNNNNSDTIIEHLLQSAHHREAEYILTGRNLDGSLNNSTMPPVIIERQEIVKKWQFHNGNSLAYDWDCAICLCRNDKCSEGAVGYVDPSAGSVESNKHVPLPQDEVDAEERNDEENYRQYRPGNNNDYVDGIQLTESIPKIQSSDRDDVLAEIPCGHLFHKSCIIMWVARTRIERPVTCPICRSNL